MKRELFKLLGVHEFPNASNKIFASDIIAVNGVDDEPEKNFNKFLVFSVLPAPVIPEMMIDCGISKMRKFLKALSAAQVR